MSYWDSSALVKLYAEEPDSQFFESFVATGTSPIVTSRMSCWEVENTLRRKEADGALQAGDAELLFDRFQADVATGAILVAAVGEDLDEFFSRVVDHCLKHHPRLLVRTSDGLHLATALLLAEQEIVATDKRLREIAVSLGLAVVP